VRSGRPIIVMETELNSALSMLVDDKD